MSELFLTFFNISVNAVWTVAAVLRYREPARWVTVVAAVILPSPSGRTAPLPITRAPSAAFSAMERGTWRKTLLISSLWMWQMATASSRWVHKRTASWSLLRWLANSQ